MEQIITNKSTLLMGVATVGGFISNLVGGFDIMLKILLIVMIIDFITGWVVAGIFKKSPKSETGSLKSDASFKGLCRKGMILLFIVIAAQLDIMIGKEFCRNAVAIGYILNETLSIIENAGLMGVYVPPIIKKAIDILNKGQEEKNKEKVSK